MTWVSDGVSMNRSSGTEYGVSRIGGGALMAWRAGLMRKCKVDMILIAIWTSPLPFSIFDVWLCAVDGADTILLSSSPGPWKSESGIKARE